MFQAIVQASPFNEQQVADDQDADATKKSTDDNGELAEGEAREEGDAKDTADDDARSTDAPADDDDDGYLSDDSDDHLEPDCLNSIIALKRFTLTLLVPIARKVEVKRAAQTVAAMLDEWKELLTPDALLTTAYQDLAPMFLSGERYGRLQVTFNQVKDANFVWNQTIRHECVNGDFIDLTWQHPEDARFLRERVLNPTAKEIVIKGVPAEMSAELIRRLLVVSKLVKRGRSIFASGFGFHRTVDPVSGLDTDRFRGLFIPHADDEYRWRTFVEDPTTGKSYLLHYPLLAVVVRWGGLEFLLIAAYIPAQAVNRSSFYRDSLEPFLQSLPSFHHILVMGDLNVVEDPDLDRTSHSGSSAENQRLLSCWGNTDLRDAFRHLHPDKREYTFFAKATRSSSRIDRALISQPLLLRLVEAKHVAITNGMTDHWRGIGVVLESADAVKKGPGIWRLRAEQTKKQGVRKIIKKIIEESAGEPADRLLGRLPACLRAYSREERKREKATRLHLTKEVERFRVRVSRYPHCQRTGRILLRKEELLEAYEKSHKEKLQTWACVEAELDGEVASGFLSAQIKARKAGTEIREVSRNGSVFSGVKEVLSAATDHFREAFGCSDGGALPVTVDRTMQRQLGEKSKVSLGAPWAEEEVRKAVRELAPGKSPGADGLPKELFDHNWDLLGPILMDLVGRFTRGEVLPQNITTAVTILLHKKGDKGDLGNYRPITLLSTVYKILAKVMASRLKTVLHEVISEDQYGFIPGRQLADAVAVVADAIDAGASGKEDWFLLMVDFQKAFDSISRDFLFSTLRKLGLPENFVSWTEGLHKGAGTRLHINGWTGEKVAVEKGVRQGCPLAPYLFLCAVEPLC
ncbi:unnamed protein product [Closterium sp. NIES-65]|nr:unnamed protein product [Closterium sp. NIES-65]